jgi:hypothetical protein
MPADAISIQTTQYSHRHERGSGCWHRETACYGLRRLVLCTACAAALTGETCQRELPQAARRASPALAARSRRKARGQAEDQAYF